MVLLPGCLCCGTKCLGDTVPDFFEIDLAVAFDGSVQSVCRTTSRRFLLPDDILYDETVTTITGSQPSLTQTVTLRAVKVLERGLTNGNLFVEYRYDDLNYTFVVRAEFTPSGPVFGVFASATALIISTTTDTKTLTNTNPVTYSTSTAQSTCSTALLRAGWVSTLSCNQQSGGTDVSVALPAHVLTSGPLEADGRQLCGLRVYPLQKSYACSPPVLTSDARFALSDNTLFPASASSSAVLGHPKNSSEETFGGFRYFFKQELVSSASGELGTPPGLSARSDWVYFGQQKATLSVLALRYGSGASAGSQFTITGFARAAASGYNAPPCLTSDLGLWVFDY
jgi:hypothetical protein